jgi:hypothetical protein
MTPGRFRWCRKLSRWTVIVEDHELPARPLVLEGAGVPPNDLTNSHQAIAILGCRWTAEVLSLSVNPRWRRTARRNHALPLS